MEAFDSYDFESTLQDDFFCGNDLDEIKKAIERRLKNDSEFAKHYDIWLNETSYNSWREFYNEMESQRDAIEDSMNIEYD